MLLCQKVTNAWARIFDTFFNRLRAFSSPFSDAKVSQITGRLFEEMFVIMFQLMNPMVGSSFVTWDHYMCHKKWYSI
ncbi:hypothetical protein TELCIR_15350 [Teladorsagia circumcincta]|uniref:Uncharacterized protein n=1 Tax=Teladorsagia circumcincta TaxID=45464 RepID=A0A2G9TYS0_TELCI|nr:hypothetical protein TELCIR_15350 [Teladorsagia circumcincta]